jgi:hypothetical protein
MLEQRAKLYSAQHDRILQELCIIAFADQHDFAEWNLRHHENHEAHARAEDQGARAAHESYGHAERDRERRQ